MAPSIYWIFSKNSGSISSNLEKRLRGLTIFFRLQYRDIARIRGRGNEIWLFFHGWRSWSLKIWTFCRKSGKYKQFLVTDLSRTFWSKREPPPGYGLAIFPWIVNFSLVWYGPHKCPILFPNDLFVVNDGHFATILIASFPIYYESFKQIANFAVLWKISTQSITIFHGR